MDPLPSTEAIRIRRHTNVSQDPRIPRYTHMGLSASDYDAECTAAPNRIPPWVLPPEEAHALFEAGYGTAPDLIYARGIPDTPHPDQSTTDEKLCTLILLEVGLCRDLGCDKKHNEKTEK